MFIVYSPEGQSFIGSVQQLPMLRVDQAKRVNKVNESEFEKLKTEHQTPTSHSQHQAIHAYEQTKKQPRKIVVRLAEIMSSPVIEVSVEEGVEHVWYLMQQHEIKYLPVTENGALVGLVSQKDILARVIVAKSGELEGIVPTTVREVMNETVVTTKGDTDIRHAAQALSGFDVGALLVMDDYQKIQGIVTEGDLIKRLANEPPIELYT